jgi:hypothetical protein
MGSAERVPDEPEHHADLSMAPQGLLRALSATSELTRGSLRGTMRGLK